MNWVALETDNTLNELQQAKGFSIVFKHSPNCNISKTALAEFQEKSDPIPKETSFYFLDVVANKQLSAEIAETFGIKHASPQILIIKDGHCIYDNSHHDISADDAAVQIILAEDVA